MPEPTRSSLPLMKHSAFVLVAAAALLTAAPSCTTTEPPTPELSVSASAPEQLGEGKLIFDFSQAIVTETEEDVVTVANRAAKPHEFGSNNLRTRAALMRDDYSLLINHYRKTGANTATLSVIATMADKEDFAKKHIVPYFQTITSDEIYRKLQYNTGDGSEEYNITFTSPTTGTAVLTEAGGTFSNTIKNISVTYIPAAATTAADATAPVPALKAPATLAHGTWMRVDYTNVDPGESTHDWLYINKGKLFRLNTEHPASSVPTTPKKLKDQEYFYLDEKGRAFGCAESVFYQATNAGFQFRFEFPNPRNIFMMVGDYTYDGDFFNYSSRPVNVVLDKADATSMSGTASGFAGRDMGFGHPKTISRVTIFR